MIKVGEGIPEHIEPAKDADEAFPDFVFERLDEDDDSAYDSGDAEGNGEQGEKDVHG